MSRFGSTILLVALIGAICCGGPPEPKGWQLEKMEITRSIEDLEYQNSELAKTIESFAIPRIAVHYFFEDQCVAVPYELHVGGHNGIFLENHTEVPVTFTIPNNLFEEAVHEVPAGEKEYVAFAEGASDFPETDYAIEAACYREPSPGPFILWP